MQFPPEPSRGKPITAAWAALVVRCLRMLAITGVVNGSFSRTLNGTSIQCNPKGGTTEQLLPPFTLYQATPETPILDAPANTFRVTPGTVGNWLPDNYDELLTAGGTSAVWHVWLEVEASYDSGAIEITSVTLDLGAEVPDDIAPGEGEPPTTFYVEVGLIFLDASGNITGTPSTLQRSINPQVVVTNVDCGSVSRSLQIL